MTRGLLSLRLCASAAIFAIASTAWGQIGGAPGAYSRMGFGARGIGMGNAMTAVTWGDVASYYNPALAPWASSRNASAAFGILSLDRTLNALHFGMPLPPEAGLSVGLINSGVKEIDGRNSDGQQTGSLQTSENQFLLGFGLRFKSGFSAGLNVKILYYNLYAGVTTMTVGLDFGVLYRLDPSFTVGATVRDINSKYKWDTGSLFGQEGQSVEDRFPVLTSLGAAWLLPSELGILSADVVFSNVKTMILRTGLEVPIIPELTLRVGLDRIDLKEKGMGVKPSFGFTLSRQIEGWTPSLQYVYVVEPFAPSGMHVISLGARF
jgi:hypothetical protein